MGRKQPLYNKYRDKPNFNRIVRLLRQKWYNLMDRCYNENNIHNYYGRVVVCDEWKTNSSMFVAWALENGFKEGLYLDRIDPNGNYEPSNCRFVTQLISQKNKIKYNPLTYDGITLSHREWSVALGYGHDTVRDRIVNCNYSEKDAIEKGVHTHSLYQHQIDILGSTYYNNKVAYYLDMGL